MALLQTLTDDFPGTSIDVVKWPLRTSEANTSVANNKLTIVSGDVGSSAYYWADSQTLDFTGSYALVNMYAEHTPGYSNETMFFVQHDEDNRVGFMMGANTLYVSYRIAGSETRTNVGDPYSPVTHGWLRVRHTSGAAIPGYSADGITWTEVAPVSVPWDPTSVYVRLMVGKWDEGDSANTSTFAKVNLPPLYASSDTGSGTDALGALSASHSGSEAVAVGEAPSVQGRRSWTCLSAVSHVTQIEGS